MEVFKANGYSYVTVVQIPKDEISHINMYLCEQPRETLKSFYDRQNEKPDFLINGGFFNMSNGVTCFNFISDYKTVAVNAQYLEGMGIIGEKTPTFGKVGDRGDWKDFISAYPPLIKDGAACSITFAKEIDYKARRSAMGYNDAAVFFVAVESPGMNFAQLQKLMLSLGCRYAINLDGGGSTKMLKGGASLTTDAYDRAVDNVIAVYLDKPEPVPEKTIYRVQTGAFSKPANAETLKAQIQALPDSIGAGYSRAYVRLIDGFYKVQVGAFSVRSNAEKVVKDLKAKGFTSFITTQ